MATTGTDHVITNREYWDDVLAGPFGERARRHWGAAEPFWGIWCIPESRLPLLPPDPAGLVAVELGCGTGYVSAWLARGGARPIGVDNSARQLATARAMQAEFGLGFPLVHADAEQAPLRDGCADFVISEYGAAIWCDPYRWIPEAARLLRPGGRLVFMGGATQLMLSLPASGPVGDRLLRDLFGLHRFSQWDGVEFYLPHGERIRLLRSCGLVVEDLVEVQAPEDGGNDLIPEITLDWARRWPSEEVWFARKA
jgi:SAM-dependent methyltransferase